MAAIDVRELPKVRSRPWADGRPAAPTTYYFSAHRVNRYHFPACICFRQKRKCNLPCQSIRNR